jgi:hypothetical protein
MKNNILLIIILVFSGQFIRANDSGILPIPATVLKKQNYTVAYKNSLNTQESIELVNLVLRAVSYAAIANEEFSTLGSESQFTNRPEAKGLLSQAMTSLGQLDLYLTNGLEDLVKNYKITQKKEFQLIVAPMEDSTLVKLKVGSNPLQMAQSLVSGIVESFSPFFGLGFFEMPNSVGRKDNLNIDFNKSDIQKRIKKQFYKDFSAYYSLASREIIGDPLYIQAMLRLRMPIAMVIDFIVIPEGKNLKGKISYELYYPGPVKSYEVSLDPAVETQNAIISELVLKGYEELQEIPLFKVSGSKDFSNKSKINIGFSAGVYDRNSKSITNGDILPIKLIETPILTLKGRPKLIGMRDKYLHLDVFRMNFSYERTSKKSLRDQYYSPVDYSLKLNRKENYLQYNILDKNGEHVAISPINTWDSIEELEDHNIDRDAFYEEYLFGWTVEYITGSDLGEVFPKLQKEIDKKIKQQGEAVKTVIKKKP